LKINNRPLIAFTLALFVGACAEVVGAPVDDIHRPPSHISYQSNLVLQGCANARMNFGTVSGGASPKDAWFIHRNKIQLIEPWSSNAALSVKCRKVSRLSADFAFVLDDDVEVVAYGARRANLESADVHNAFASYKAVLTKAKARVSERPLVLLTAIVCDDRHGGESFGFSGLASGGGKRSIRLVLAVACDEATKRQGSLNAELLQRLGTAMHEAAHVEMLVRSGSSSVGTAEVANETLAHMVAAELRGVGFWAPEREASGAGSSLCGILGAGNRLVDMLAPAQAGEPTVFVSERCDGAKCDLENSRTVRAAMAEVLALNGFPVAPGERVPASVATAMLDRWGMDRVGLEAFVRARLQCVAPAPAMP
jgi:hypothetical protein